MRRLKLAAFSLALVAAASAPVMAQGNMGRMDPAQMMQRSTDRLMTGITLSATQSDSVKALNASFATEAKAGMGDTANMRTRMTDMRTRQRAALRGVLTPDQQAVFDKNVTAMDQARMSRPQP
jgi:hypothetical protein